jgi:hypothetical protein
VPIQKSAAKIMLPLIKKSTIKTASLPIQKSVVMVELFGL